LTAVTHAAHPTAIIDRGARIREGLKAAERDELVKRHGFSAYDYHE